MSWALSATGRRNTLTNLKASNLISTILLSQANNGARGNAATKIVMKPNCITTKYIHSYITYLVNIFKTNVYEW